MFCNRCGREIATSAKFCQSCGAALDTTVQFRAVAPVSGKRRLRLLWILIAFPAAGILLSVLSVLLSHDHPNHESPNTVARPNIPTPKFRVFRQERGKPVPIIVSRDITETQLRSLLWFFRENVRERHFDQLGLKKATGPAEVGFDAGMLEVFRDAKYANEPFTRKDGEPTQAVAVYGWGTDRQPDHDEAYLQAGGGNQIKVFDSSDGWQLPPEEQQRVDEEKKAEARCTTDDPMAILPAQGVLTYWEGGSSSAHYWLGGIENKHLFAVKEHELLERYYVADEDGPGGRKPNSSAFKFRVQSTTQGGFPITKDWDIDVTLSDGECKV